MVLAFTYAGLADSDGLIISILFGLVNLMVGVIGGIVWVASGYKRRSIETIATDTIVNAPSS
jgi:glycosyltransferase 2 family protein